MPMSVEKSQHAHSFRQMVSRVAQPAMRHAWVIKVSQYCASKPAQSALLVHALPNPLGDLRQ